MRKKRKLQFTIHENGYFYFAKISKIDINQISNHKEREIEGRTLRKYIMGFVTSSLSKAIVAIELFCVELKTQSNQLLVLLLKLVLMLPCFECFAVGIGNKYSNSNHGEPNERRKMKSNRKQTS